MKKEILVLKRKLTAAIFVATLFFGSTIGPASAQDNGQTMQNDNKMSDSKMKDDKMDNKMAGNSMSKKKRKKHKKPAKNQMDNKMDSSKNK